MEIKNKKLQYLGSRLAAEKERNSTPLVVRTHGAELIRSRLESRSHAGMEQRHCGIEEGIGKIGDFLADR